MCHRQSESSTATLVASILISKLRIYKCNRDVRQIGSHSKEHRGRRCIEHIVHYAIHRKASDEPALGKDTKRGVLLTRSDDNLHNVLAAEAMAIGAP